MIVDGYTDEPAGLGVPPYIDVYPRYIAGAVLAADPSAEVTYYTVDEFRMNLEKCLKASECADIVVFIAGVVVPGKYLGGRPITFGELIRWPSLLNKPLRVLVGPAARFGFGTEGGEIAIHPKTFENIFDLVVKGDPEMVIFELVREKLSTENVDPFIIRDDYSMTSIFSIKGSLIVTQHPNYGKNLIAEIETFRGCPRWIAGGCSFCVEPGYGPVVFRDERDIAREVRTLHDLGVRNFRLGRQPDFFAYKAKGVNEEEFPEPNPKAVERLLRMIREGAPNIETLHIDNVNPGTVAHHPERSLEVARILMEYHTPGDVAAMGVESADPAVIKANNLKATPQDSLEAVRIINEVGRRRGYNGLPHLLPGINFVAGLIGETKRTYLLNRLFLQEILEEGLLVRRVNIRQVLPLPSTRMWRVGNSLMRGNKRYFAAFKSWVREKFDRPMLERIAPKGTIMRGLFVEGHSSGYSLARQAGSYPLLVHVTEIFPLWSRIDVVVVRHKARSVTGIPYPLNVNRASLRSLKLVPDITKTGLDYIVSHRPFNSLEELANAVGKTALRYLAI